MLIKRREDDYQPDQGGRCVPRRIDLDGPCIELDVDDETMIVLSAAEVMAIVEIAGGGQGGWLDSIPMALASTGVEAASRSGYAQGLREGLREGIRRFAWWKDGRQFVGTSGKTLEDALAEIGEC